MDEGVFSHREWLRAKRHDVLDAFELNLGDAASLERAEAKDRIPVTIDTEFGEFLRLRNCTLSEAVRLPHVTAQRRIPPTDDRIERRLNDSTTSLIREATLMMPADLAYHRAVGSGHALQRLHADAAFRDDGGTSDAERRS